MLEHEWFPRPLPANVELGERAWIYSSYAFTRYRSERPCGVRIGNDSGVYIGSVFDLGPEGEVRIGDYCAVSGPVFCTNGLVEIGDYAFISYEVVFADSSVALPPPARARFPHVTTRPSLPIVVGKDVWIGTRTVILGGARIGDGAIVGAGAVVDFEVPDYAIVGGNPARVVGWARPQTGEPASRQANSAP